MGRVGAGMGVRPVGIRGLVNLLPDALRQAAAWDDRRLAAQVFLWGFAGAEPDGPLVRGIEAGLGGVILFARNATHPVAAARLTARLQALAAAAGAPPLLVAVDQEGGTVARLREGFPVFPGAMALGAAGDLGLARRAAALTGRMLRAAGVHVNLAPVADVLTEAANPVIGVRSFGSDPREVARFVAAWVEGQQGAGVAATAKHFPGHGDTRVDSHHALPVVPHGRRRLKRVELVPFRAAVDAGVLCVMAAHVAVPRVEPDARVPATLSRAVLTGLLRGELGFRGVVVTDCMEMGVLRDRDPGEAAVRALDAGADLVLYSHTPELQEAALAAVVRVLRSGRLDRRRVVEAAARVLALKQVLGLMPRRGPAGAGPAALDPGEAAEAALAGWAPEAAALAGDIARRSVTRLGPPWPRLDPGGRVLVLEFAGGRASPVEDAHSAGVPSLAAALAPHAPGWTVRGVPLEPGPREVADVLASVRDGAWERVVVATRGAAFRPPQLRAVRAVLAERPDALLVAVGSPPDALRLPASTALVGYDATPATLAALADAVLGRLRPEGRLPLPVPPAAAGGGPAGATPPPLGV